MVWISLSEEIRKTTNFIAFRTMSTAHFFNFDFPKLLLKIARKKGQTQKKKEKKKEENYMPVVFHCAFSDNML